MQRKNNQFILPKLDRSVINKSLNSSTSSKLKIPPAFTPDVWICDHSKKRTKSEDTKIKPKSEFILNKIKKIPPIINPAVQEWVCNHHKHVERNPETNLITQWKYKRPKLIDKSNKNNEETRDVSKQRRRLNSLKRRSISYDKQLLDYYRRMVNETYNDKYVHLFKNNKGEFENKFYRGILPSPIKIKNKYETCNVSDNFVKTIKNRKIKSLDNDHDILNSTPINELKKSVLDKICRKKKHFKIVENDKVKLLNQDVSFRKQGFPKVDSANIIFSRKLKQKTEISDNKTVNEKNELKLKKAKLNGEHIEMKEFEESENELRSLFSDKNNDYIDDSFITDASMNSLKISKNFFEEMTRLDSKVENRILNISLEGKNEIEPSRASSNSLIYSNRTMINSIKTDNQVLLKIEKDELDDSDSYNAKNVDFKAVFNENNFETIFESNNEKNSSLKLTRPSTESNIQVNQDCAKSTQTIFNDDESKFREAKKSNKKLKKSPQACKKQVEKVKDHKKTLIDKAIQNDSCESLKKTSADKTKCTIKASSTSTIEKRGFYEEFNKNGTKRLIKLQNLSKSYQDYSSIRKSTNVLRKKHTQSVDRMSYTTIASNKNNEIKKPNSSFVESINNADASITSKVISDDNFGEILKQESNNINMEDNIKSKIDIKEEDIKTSNEIIDKKHYSSREGSSTSSRKSVNIVKPFVIVSNPSKTSNKDKVDQSRYINKCSDSLSTVTYTELEANKISHNKSKKTHTDQKKMLNFLNKCCCFKNNKILFGNPQNETKNIGLVSSSDKEAHTEEWIDSGKTKLGLKLERLLRKYEKLSHQKKCLILLLLILLFLLFLALIIATILIIRGPKQRIIYVITSYPDNITTHDITKLTKTTTTSTASTTMHIKTTCITFTTLSTITTTTKMVTSTSTTSTSTTTTTTTTTTPKIGLVGDSCIRIIGDCGNYMECKTISPGWNISTCQCRNGYVAHFDRECRGLVNSNCKNNNECSKHMVCLKETSSSLGVCNCRQGYYQKDDKTCFGKYNSTCEVDEDCLRNGQCKAKHDSIRRCECTTKEKSFYSPSSDYYRQCKLLIGSSCSDNEDCIEYARCKKYCSCREFDVFFETDTKFCDDGCKNKSDIYFSSGTARRYPHPTLCGFYFTCDPRELDRCTSSYSFNYTTQSCDSAHLCK